MQRFLSLFLSCLLLMNTCLAGVVCAEEEGVGWALPTNSSRNCPVLIYLVDKSTLESKGNNIWYEVCKNSIFRHTRKGGDDEFEDF